MLSPSRRLIVPLFITLSLLLATAVEAHDVPLHLRDHGNMKRLMKKRSPFPADSDPVIPTVVAGAAGIPTLASTSASVTSTSTTATSTSSTSTTSASSATATSSTATSSSTTGTASSTTGSSTSSSSVTSTSSTQTSTSSTSTTAAAVTSASLNIAQAPSASTSTVVQANVTSTAFAAAQSTDTVATTVSGASSTDSESGKSTIVTVLIVIAASIGGIAILWTVFRKWKLSSSKKFDERLRPIDWQQPTADDGAIPTHRRNSGASSFRSGSGHGHGDALDHDFTAGPASTVGGYADLARGPAAPPMTENLTRGPSFNRPFDTTVPLHHQGYGGARY